MTGEGNRLPRSTIHSGIVSVLNDFATNLTRYYNLALITGDPKVEQVADPVRAWFEQVTQPVLDEHYKQRHREKHQLNAKILSELFGEHVSVLHHAQNGEQLNSVEDAAALSGLTEFAIPDRHE